MPLFTPPNNLQVNFTLDNYISTTYVGTALDFQLQAANTVGKGLVCSYNIGEFAPVFKATSFPYHLFNSAVQQNQFPYTILQVIQSSQELPYQIGSVIYRDLTISYSVFRAEGRDLVFHYNIGISIPKDIQYNYTLRGAVAGTYSLVYSIGSIVGTSLKLSYKLIAPAIKDLACPYNLGLGPIGKSLVLSYRLGQILPYRDLICSYNLGSGSIHQDIKLDYKMLFITKLLKGQYQIKLRAGNPTRLQSQFNNLMGLYHFNESSYAGVDNEVIDSSGYGHHGITRGTSLPTVVPGLFGNASSFSNGYIEVLHHPHFNLTSSFTIMFWLRPSSLTGSILYKGTGGSPDSYNYSVYLNSSKLVFGGGSYGYVTSNLSLSSDIWYFVTCMFTGTHLYLYIDGYLDSSQPRLAEYPQSNTENVIIGSSFQGLLDELIICNQATDYHRLIHYYLQQPPTVRPIDQLVS